MKKIFLFSMLATALAACKKDDTNPQNITYNIAAGAWSNSSSIKVLYLVNGDTVVYLPALSSNYRDETGTVKEGDSYSLTVTNNTAGGTIGADVYIQKCIDGSCGDYYPVMQNHTTNGTVTSTGTVQDPEQ